MSKTATIISAVIVAAVAIALHVTLEEMVGHNGAVIGGGAIFVGIAYLIHRAYKTHEEY